MSRYYQTTIMSITATGVWLNMFLNLKREFENNIIKDKIKCRRGQK